MKLIHSDIKKGEAKVKIENLDDLWYLSTIIDANDELKGKTIRKIKIGEKDERSANVSKKAVFLKLKAEKIEFSKTSNILRVSGKITEGPEDIPKGSYHTFNIEINSIITITKDRWLSFQLDKLNEACSTKVAKILICVHDREEAYFALMKKYGYEMLTDIKGNVAKKGIEEKTSSNFYLEIISQIKEYVERYKIQTVILASPAFWKEDLMKNLKDNELKNKIVLCACSSVGKNGVDEVLKREETKQALKSDRIAQEVNLVEQLMQEISKNNLAVYGLKDTDEAITIGAVDVLLVTDAIIQKTRQQGTYGKIDSLIKAADKMKGHVYIISSEHDGGKRLNGLGGIAAILRFKLRY